MKIRLIGILTRCIKIETDIGLFLQKARQRVDNLTKEIVIYNGHEMNIYTRYDLFLKVRHYMPLFLLMLI